MKIVITGATGYIGARLSKYLADKGHEIVAVCYSSITDVDQWAEKFQKIIRGDIREQKIIYQIANENADAVIHLVSLDHFASEKDLHLVSQINVLPTWNLLRECTKAGLKKFIFFSTVNVYGNLGNATLVNEDHPVKTGNTYGLTHYLSENICNHYNRNSNTHVISARLSNSYGAPIFPENNCWWLVINDLCKSAYQNKRIKLLSDGSPQRDFIHGNDLCKAVELLLNTDDKNNENSIYHVSSGKTYTILELAGKIKSIFNDRYSENIPISTSKEHEVIDFNIFSRNQRYTIDNSKLRDIGFEPLWDLDKGVNELFDYMENLYGT